MTTTRDPGYCYYRTLMALLAWIVVVPMNASSSNQLLTNENVTVVNAEQTIELLEREHPVFIDSRIRSDRLHGFIEGSVSLPDIDTTCKTLAAIIPEKSAPSLFYCNGIACGRSVKAIEVALACGYTNIYWYQDGFQDWKAKDLPYITD